MIHNSTNYLAKEDWHMPIESSQYFIILFRVNQVFTFYHFIIIFIHIIVTCLEIMYLINYKLLIVLLLSIVEQLK